LVVHNADSFNAMRLIFGKIGLDLTQIGTAAPIALDELSPKAQLFSHFLPQGRKVPCLKH
ncbi:MAG: hypothetical protein ACKVLN_03235, partial [Rhodobacterales bacterium]